MATRKPLVIIGDHIVEITSPDTIDPSVLPASSGGSDPSFAYFMA